MTKDPIPVTCSNAAEAVPHEPAYTMPTLDLNFRWRCACGTINTMPLIEHHNLPPDSKQQLDTLPAWHRPDPDAKREEIESRGGFALRCKEVADFDTLLSPEALILHRRRISCAAFAAAVLLTPERLTRNRDGEIYFLDPPAGTQRMLDLPLVKEPEEQRALYRSDVRTCVHLGKVAPCISEEDRRPQPQYVKAFAETINRLVRAKMIAYGTLAGLIAADLIRTDEGVYRVMLLYTTFSDCKDASEIDEFLGNKIVTKEGELGSDDWTGLFNEYVPTLTDRVEKLYTRTLRCTSEGKPVTYTVSHPYRPSRGLETVQRVVAEFYKADLWVVKIDIEPRELVITFGIPQDVDELVRQGEMQRRLALACIGPVVSTQPEG